MTLDENTTHINRYVDKFFDMLVLYDDNQVFRDGTKSDHDYKGLLHPSILSHNALAPQIAP